MRLGEGKALQGPKPISAQKPAEKEPLLIVLSQVNPLFPKLKLSSLKIYISSIQTQCRSSAAFLPEICKSRDFIECKGSYYWQQVKEKNDEPHTWIPQSAVCYRSETNHMCVVVLTIFQVNIAKSWPWCEICQQIIDSCAPKSTDGMLRVAVDLRSNENCNLVDLLAAG